MKLELKVLIVLNCIYLSINKLTILNNTKPNPNRNLRKCYELIWVNFDMFIVASTFNYNNVVFYINSFLFNNPNTHTEAC